MRSKRFNWSSALSITVSPRAGLNEDVARIALIAFQVVMAILFFGLAAFSWAQAGGPRAIPGTFWLTMIRALSFLGIGALFTLFASRHVMRLGKRYQGGGPTEP